MSPEIIAEVCHEACRALTRHAKDVPEQPPWPDAPEEMRTSTIAGVKWGLEHLDAPPSASHEDWMRLKMDAGWTWGMKKDAFKKTHPAIVPWEKLPPETRAKDAVFTAIIRALAPSIPKHRWEYCDHCQSRMVVCGYCGNNCCNGGSEDHCPDRCASAYALQDAGEKL